MSESDIKIDDCPCFNMHLAVWNNGIGPAPELPEGPIKLYDPVDGLETASLPLDARIEVEFRGAYPTMMAAIWDISGEFGRFPWSRPREEHYLGFLNHLPGSVVLVVF